MLAAIRDRLLDDDESIRKQAVAVVLDVASHELSSVSSDTIKLVAARLEDKSVNHPFVLHLISCLYSLNTYTRITLTEILFVIQVLVKKYTLERLSDIYRIWCLKQLGGLNLNDDYAWIPGRILKCLYDKDLGYVTLLILFWQN